MAEAACVHRTSIIVFRARTTSTGAHARIDAGRESAPPKSVLMWDRRDEESPVKEIEINARGMTFQALADGPEDGPSASNSRLNR